MTSQALPPSTDLSAGGLINATLALVKAHPWALLLPLAVLGLARGGDNPQYRWDATDPQGALELLPFYAFLGLVAVLVFLLLFAIYAVALAVTTRTAFAALHREERADPRVAFNDVRPMLWGSVGTFALWVLAIVVGFILLVVPGFILLAGLAPWMAVVVAERKSGVAALQRAWELTHGHRLDLFLVGLLGIVASGVAQALLSWIPAIGDPLAGAAGGAVLAMLVASGAVFYDRRVAAAPAGPAQPAPPYAPVGP